MPEPIRPVITNTLLLGWDSNDLVLENGDPVETWMGVNGSYELDTIAVPNGTTPHYQINAINNHPGVVFEGGDYLGVIGPSLNDVTIFFVMTNPENTGAVKNMLYSNGYLFTALWSSVGRWIFGQSEFSFIEFTDNSLPGAPCIWTYVHKGTGSFVRAEQTQRVSGNVGLATSNSFRMGHDGGGQSGFTMFECLVYDGEVSAGDIALIESYLAEKWYTEWFPEPEPTGPTFVAQAQGQFVYLSVQGVEEPPEGATVTITRRTYDNTEIRVRGIVDAPIVSDGFIGYDYEAPQGRNLTYTAYITYPDDSTLILYADAGIVDYGGDYIMPVGRWEFGMTLFVEWDGISPREHSMIQDTVPVLGRKGPVSVSWGRLMPRGSISFLTMEDFDRRNFLRLIEYPVIMFAARSDFGYDDPVFLSLEVVTEERTIGYGGESSRRWICDVQEVDRPPATYVLPVLAIPWQSVLDIYGTWDALRATGNTWYQTAGYP